MKAIYNIVGIKHRGADAVVARLRAGHPLRLEREPTNTYDARAVKVLALLSGDWLHIGYVRAAENAKLAESMDAAGAPRDAVLSFAPNPHAEVQE